jgi:hypothetical protein
MTIRKTDDFMAMKGAGYYSKATVGAKQVMDNAAGLVLDAIDREPPSDDGNVFSMTDMGSADGGTSIDMIGRILKDIRTRCPSRPIEITYTDLPRNDFSQLFRIVHGQTSIKSYLQEIDDVYVFASATSFHRQIVPAGTLQIGHSATASHYITQVPCSIPDHVHMVGASGQTRAAYLARGADDWRSFLLHRTRELAPRGFLALFNFGIDEEGRYLGHTGGVSMFDTFDEIWRAMVGEGTITEAEYEATNFPQVYRTVGEFRAPLEDSKSDVYRAGLRLEHVETRVLRCPFALDFETHGDAAAFAKAYIPTLRSWSEPVFFSGLTDERLPEERAEIIDDFYGRYEARVAEAPEGHGMDYVHCYMICRKI